MRTRMRTVVVSGSETFRMHLTVRHTPCGARKVKVTAETQTDSVSAPQTRRSPGEALWDGLGTRSQVDAAMEIMRSRGRGPRA